jgi:aryl-alcohol dehydrogenase-like predicted oxidoreductase
MRPPSRELTRRSLLAGLASTGAASVLRSLAPAAKAAPVTKPIPSSGEKVPAVGIGSWITFNVGDDRAARDSCSEVLRSFFQEGGRLIDSSPMYGSSQEVIGYCLRKLGRPPELFSADKVWISSASAGSRNPGGAGISRASICSRSTTRSPGRITWRPSRR